MSDLDVPRYQRLLESELERMLNRLKTELPLSEEYADTLAIVERLNGMMDKPKPSGVSKDVMANIAAHLVGIVLIIKHEHVGVITTRALSFVPKLRA